MAGFRTLDDVKVSGRTVLVRVDLNVPMQDGEITDTTRIDRVVDSLRDLSAAGAKVVVMSHFGRPKGPAPGEHVAETLAGGAFQSEIPSRDRCRLRRRLHRSKTGAGDQVASLRPYPASRKPPLPSGRRGQRPELRGQARRSRRHLRQRCLFLLASRPRLDHRHRRTPARRSRPPDAAGDRCAEQGAGKAQTAR